VQELVLSMKKKQQRKQRFLLRLKNMKQVLQGFYTSTSSEKNMVIMALKVADQAESMCKLFHCHIDLPHGTFLPGIPTSFSNIISLPIYLL